MAYQSINPSDGRLLASFEHLSSEQLEAALARAQEAFQV
jgi:succinate-semialdehyde dehydrogenase / glutarate-semialdehyde dehydrogenase